MTRPRYLPDNFTPALLGSIGLASFLPVRGYAAQGFEWLTTAAIALLFFFYMGPSCRVRRWWRV